MPAAAAGPRSWLSEADCDLDDFRALVEQITDPREYPLADSVDRNVPLYDGDRLRALAATPQRRLEVQALIGNVDEHCEGKYLKLTAEPDGSFTVSRALREG